jgi:hypothetical protein
MAKYKRDLDYHITTDDACSQKIWVTRYLWVWAEDGKSELVPSGRRFYTSLTRSSRLRLSKLIPDNVEIYIDSVMIQYTNLEWDGWGKRWMNI